MNQVTTESQQRERIRIQIYDTADEASCTLAREIAELIRARAKAGRSVVLGLATGGTPVRLYRELIRMHREEGLSFANVVTFNLDEYHGLPREHSQSYWRFMHEQLFDHIDIPASAINVPDGMVPRAEVFAWCRAYEQKIKDAGGIDLQVLGIGRTGHIGFNEPGSGADSRTRLVTLDSMTRRDAARDFIGEANVPRHAITMGVGSILDARRIVLLSWGGAKARVVADAAEKPPSEALPASFLQQHGDVTFHVDRASASELTRIKLPWLVGPVEWTPAISRRAVVWLSRQVKKPVLKLLDDDYTEHGMTDLLTEQGPAYILNIRIFNELQHTITGWPGGKPDADDTHRPERAAPHPKRVLVLSPEPSDDVIGMGGTIRRLVEQGHQVTVACQTSGNLGVPDEEAASYADFMIELEDSDAKGASNTFVRKIRQQLDEKSAFDIDPPELRRFKGALRREEERAAVRACGVTKENSVFLDLPFYEQGRYRQFRIGDADVDAVVALLRKIEPHQIFATGASEDPSSLPAICFSVLRQALEKTRGDAWRRDCRVWIYRGASGIWDIAEIDMAVPMSPMELSAKIQSICHHKSQRSQTPARSQQAGEAWQQAEQHNQSVARAYDEFGLANYEAIEPFRQWME
ncbi:glucosamine-6-phosphate deaminase [Ereboglobus luteus]|uniref:Glucosamine-6-phosphate deaminase n=1 Tax=Ereboglobus luteus TaxID=1796921 RepID=A0A2U8E689_9BACT|nr:glucosamine-6-phosphate deaminase [Ereboglobus luteus]AWI10074.1 glucosamine-6-phosphate deaminase [Ereboglobus luteus]